MPEFLLPGEKQSALDLADRLDQLARYAAAESIDGDLLPQDTAYGAGASTIRNLLDVLSTADRQIDYWIDLWKRAAHGAMGCRECSDRFAINWRNKIMEDV